MLKGQTFSEQVFESKIYSLFTNIYLSGKNGVARDYKNGMAVSYSGNDVTIASGAVCIQGRILEEDSSTTLDAGSVPLYCKLVIEVDLDKTNTENDFQQGAYKIVTGESSYPSLTQTDIANTASGKYQYELARFRTSSNGISDFQDMRTFLESTTEFKKNSDFVVYTSEKATGNSSPYIEESLPNGWNSNNCVIISVAIGRDSTAQTPDTDTFWTSPSIQDEYTGHIFTWMASDRFRVHTDKTGSDGANWIRAVLMKIS